MTQLRLAELRVVQSIASLDSSPLVCVVLSISNHPGRSEPVAGDPITVASAVTRDSSRRAMVAKVVVFPAAGLAVTHKMRHQQSISLSRRQASRMYPDNPVALCTPHRALHDR